MFPGRAFWAVFICFLLSACSNSSSVDPEVKPADSTTSTTTTDPWAIPETIDIAYAQRVIQELTNIAGVARADVIDNHRFTEETQSRIRAVYQGPLTNNMLKQMSDNSIHEIPDIVKNPPAWKVRITEIVSSSHSCMYVFGIADDQLAHKNSISPSELAWGLKRDETRSDFNQTTWRFVQEIPKYATPGNPCA